MAIDLSNVNISLNEFQRISSGTHNAGEVKLAGTDKLAKMNHHVGTFLSNNETISHAEVIAIKQALVKTLSQNGVMQDEINRIRQDLGLATRNAADKNLLYRSVVPLTRQQVRAILDRNAATINAYNAEHRPGEARLRASTQIYGPGGMDKATAARRDAVNATLAVKSRKLDVNEEISLFEKVVSDWVDYNPSEEREKILEVAKGQLDKLMQACHCRPREDHAAVATLELEDGQKISVPTGMSEKAFAERLENIIVRFSRTNYKPARAEREVFKDYRALKTWPERQAFLAKLPNDPEFGLKARSLAVQCLYGCRVNDYATLSLANRLSAADALSLATALLGMPKNSTPEQIRANPVLVELATKEPVEPRQMELAYIPATSNAQYNKFVLDSLDNNPDNLLPAHRNLAEEAKRTVRERLGAVAMPDNKSIGDIVASARGAGIYLDDWEVRRNTVETIRESYMASALKKGALLIVSDELEKAIRSAGGNPEGDGWMVTLRMEERHPDLIRQLASAKDPAAASAIVAKFKAEIDQQAIRYCKLKPFWRNIQERTMQTIAAKLGVEPGTIADFWEKQKSGIIRAIGSTRNDLMSDILSGRVQANTDAEIKAEFQKLVDKTVAGLMAALKQVDDLNPPLPPPVADLVKSRLYDLQKFKRVDVGRIVGEMRKRADTARLDELLQGNGEKAAIKAELLNLFRTANAIMLEMLADKDEIGPDDRDGIMAIAGVFLVSGRPGLADRLDAFFLRPDIQEEITDFDEGSQEIMAMNFFREFSFNPDVFDGGPFEASKAHRLFAEPRELAQ